MVAQALSDSPVSQSLSPDARIEAVAESPVFLVGAPRSGTTWLQRLLLTHPAVCGGQESHFFALIAPVMQRLDALNRNERPVGPTCYWGPGGFERRIRDLWVETCQPLLDDRPSAEVLLEKTPEHALHMQSIIEMLPKARFIHLIRDSRAVVASLLAASRESWGRTWAPATVERAAILWHAHVTRARAVGEPLGPDRYMELYYEDLRREPIRHLRRAFAFLGLEISTGELEQAVSEQAIERQREIGGTPLPSVTPNRAEPAGFFRAGATDGWKRELSLWQKLVVWRFTRRVLREHGYTWEGRP